MESIEVLNEVKKWASSWTFIFSAIFGGIIWIGYWFLNFYLQKKKAKKAKAQQDLIIQSLLIIAKMHAEDINHYLKNNTIAKNILDSLFALSNAFLDEKAIMQREKSISVKELKAKHLQETIDKLKAINLKQQILSNDDINKKLSDE